MGFLSEFLNAGRRLGIDSRKFVHHDFRQWPYLNQGYDLKNGKLWPNERPGFGMEVDTSRLQLIGDYKEPYVLTPMLKRPDGSLTNW